MSGKALALRYKGEPPLGRENLVREASGKHMAAQLSTLNRVLNELAASDVPVLLLGEPGVGKRFVARKIHEAAPWSAAPFVECSCKAMDDNAIRTAFGKSDNCNRWTLYLDSVEALGATSQRALLACLEAKREEKYSPRLIASATSDLETEVRTGRFREDLYYRLSGVCIPIPPLRYRKDDIEALAEIYLEKYANEFNRPKPEMAPSLLRFLQSHPWTGNLHELEEAMRTVVAVGNVRVAISALQSSVDNGNGREKRNVSAPPVSLKQVARAASQRAERELILKVLTRTHWNRKKAAEELRISYKALLYKLKEINSTPGTVVGQGGRG